MKIKICGITDRSDALEAASLGADILGFVFYPESKRHIEPYRAASIIRTLPASTGKAGVFVDEPADVVRETAVSCGLDVLQFHGSETSGYCGSFRQDYRVIKAFRIRSKKDLSPINGYDADYYLLDTYVSGSAGGTGVAFDWKILKDFEFLKPVILSGGLTPENVAAAIREVSPYGVDVSTGVEKSPGKKDHELMKRFIEEARKA